MDEKQKNVEFLRSKIKQIEGNDEKSEVYAEYKKLQAELKEIQTVKNNIDQSLGNQRENDKER